MDEDEKRPYMLHSEVGKPIKEMRDKKATGNDEVLKLLREESVKIMIQLINNISETRE